LYYIFLKGYIYIYIYIYIYRFLPPYENTTFSYLLALIYFIFSFEGADKRNKLSLSKKIKKKKNRKQEMTSEKWQKIEQEEEGGEMKIKWKAKRAWEILFSKPTLFYP